MTLYVEQRFLSDLSCHAADAWPEECCGLLIGRRDAGDARVTRVVPAENIASGDRRRSYQIDWRVLIDTFRAAREGPDAVLGFYHSHPDGSSRPSKRDRQSAWADYRYLILAARDGSVAEMTCWRIDDEQTAFVREPFVVRSPPARIDD